MDLNITLVTQRKLEQADIFETFTMIFHTDFDSVLNKFTETTRTKF